MLPRDDCSRYVAEKASADHVGVAEVASRVRAPPALRSTSEGDTQFHDSQPEDHFKVSFGNPTIVETWRHGQKFTKFSRRTSTRQINVVISPAQGCKNKYQSKVSRYLINQNLKTSLFYENNSSFLLLFCRKILTVGHDKMSDSGHHWLQIVDMARGSAKAKTKVRLG